METIVKFIDGGLQFLRTASIFGADFPNLFQSFVFQFGFCHFFGFQQIHGREWIVVHIFHQIVRVRPYTIMGVTVRPGNTLVHPSVFTAEDTSSTPPRFTFTSVINRFEWFVLLGSIFLTLSSIGPTPVSSIPPSQPFGVLEDKRLVTSLQCTIGTFFG